MCVYVPCHYTGEVRGGRSEPWMVVVVVMVVSGGKGRGTEVRERG